MAISKTLLITSISIIVMCTILGGYLFHAQSKKKWPFSVKKDDRAAALKTSEEDGKLSSAAVIFIVIAVLLVIGVSVYLTILRYKIVGSALEHNQGGVAAAALAPEIGAGVGSIFHGNRGY